MRSEIIKFTLTKIRSKGNFVLLLFLVLFYVTPTQAQNYQFTFKDIPLSKALNEVSAKTHCKLSFDVDLLKKTTVTANIDEADIPKIIEQLLEGSNFIYEKKYDTYLIIRKKDGTEKSVPVKYLTISGIVFEEESGERLPYASVVETDDLIAVSTNVEGGFSLRLIDSSDIHLVVRYMGYQPVDTIIGKERAADFLRIGLKQQMQTIETVDISGARIEMLNSGKDAGHVTFNPSKFVDLPNYGETDVFRALQLLPGISSFENSSQLNVRGSSADQNLVLLDGFTLYNLDHFFGVFSALNPNVIKNIQVYRGGFDSRYGERVSAIVDIVGKSGNQSKPTVYGGINMISANLTAEIPITQKLTVVAAGRRAYSDMYSTWLADELLNDKLGQIRFPDPNATVITPEFYFSDFNLKLSYQLNETENFSVSAYGSKDYLNSSNEHTNDRGEFSVDDVNEWGNYGYGATWNKQWNEVYFSSLQFGHSGYFNDYSNTTSIIANETLPPLDSAAVQDNVITEVTNESNRLTDYFMTFRNELNSNQNQQLEFGLSVKYNQYTFYKDASRDFVYDNLENSSFLFTGFIQDGISAGKKLAIKPGVRINYYTNSAKFYIEPRLTGNYSFTENWNMKFATGRYVQFLNKSGTEQSYGYNRDFWVLADGDVNPVVTSNHYIAGVSFEKNDLYIDLEGYYKTVDGLQEYIFTTNPDGRNNPPSSQGAFSQFVSGSGKAMGLDFLAKYEGTRFTTWLAYSISKSTRRFGEINDGAEIPGNFDQTHELKWTNLYNLKKWNFSTLAIYNTGKPYVESSVVDADFNATRVYKRLPDYFRVDLSMNYNFKIKNVNIKPGLSVLNAFNTENYLDAYTRVVNFGDYTETLTTLVKAQSLTFNFFVNFRF